MIRENPAGPTVERRERPLCFHSALENASADHGRCISAKLKTMCSSSSSSVVGGKLSRCPQRHLADHDPFALVVVEHTPNASQELMRARMLVGADDVEMSELVRSVRQPLVLSDQMDDIGAKAVDTTIEPETEDAVHRLDDLCLGPVEVGLLGEEEVEIPLPRCGVPCPRRPTERRPPVVRRLVAQTISPDVPVAPRRITRRPRLEKPRMDGARVVGHPIEENPEPAPVCLDEQTIERLGGRRRPDRRPYGR